MADTLGMGSEVRPSNQANIMTTSAVHPGGLNATQSLAFFRANGITGSLVRRYKSGTELRQYTCPTVHIGGLVASCSHRILAPAFNHAPA